MERDRAATDKGARSPKRRVAAEVVEDQHRGSTSRSERPPSLRSGWLYCILNGEKDGRGVNIHIQIGCYSDFQRSRPSRYTSSATHSSSITCILDGEEYGRTRNYYLGVARARIRPRRQALISSSLPTTPSPQRLGRANR